MLKKIVLSTIFFCFFAASSAVAEVRVKPQVQSAQQTLMRRRACDVILSWFDGPGDYCWTGWDDQCERYYQGWLRNGCYGL